MPEKIDGDEHADVEYEITRAEWEAKPGGGFLVTVRGYFQIVTFPGTD